ncbi:MAG: PIG-L family deacetylase [Anaerolineae bacterium]|jgi:LmbE family N-acetylglucosaminyl deacetylase|nr:PIG-L family deacetylase [Anaerolineae bacterium]
MTEPANGSEPTPRFDISQFGAIGPEGDIKRLLVVAAHPDDLETTCGGTLALLVDAGVEVALLLCTDGDIGTHDLSYTRESLAATRREETLAGAQALGLKEVFFLGHHDGELVADLQLRAEVAGAYRRFLPDTIFTFDPYWHGQAHPDHNAAGRAAVDAYMPSKMELYHPEQLIDGVTVADVKRFFFFGGSERANAITVDISSAWERKVKATRCHVSQFGQREEALQWLEQWNRETGKCCGLEFAEAFTPMTVW